MASFPPSLWAVDSTTQHRDERAPTQEEYLSLLHHECRRRGLIDWNDELTDAHVVRAFPPESYVEARPPRHTDLTKEQWADPSDPINTFESQEVNKPLNDSDWNEQTVDRARQQDCWNETRNTIIKHYASQHLPTITKNIKRDFLAAGGTQQRLDEIHTKHSTNAILYWLAELWNLQGQTTTRKHPKQEQTLSIMVFSDIPQEDLEVVRCQISYHETWSGFTSTMNQHLLVRYLVKKHHPASIADALFVDDDTVWPPEGVLPFRDEDDKIVNPEQDHARRADLGYDDGRPGRGWWSSVVPKQSATGLLGKYTEWKALNTAEDWDSLMKWLDGHREATAAFRHQSTKERVEFVAEQRGKEDTVLGFPGYRAFNVYLDRHRREVDQRQLYGSLRKDSERLMQVPRDSERLQSDASNEIDAVLREGGIEKVEIDDEEEVKDVGGEESKGKCNDESAM